MGDNRIGTLHPITGVPKGYTRWCGPSAIAAITGLTYEAARTLLRGRRLSRGITKPVKGVSRAEMRDALQTLGYTMLCLPLLDSKELTLARWIAKRPKDLVPEIVLVNTTGHWLVVKGRKAADSKHPQPVFTSQFGGRRARVKAAYRVRPDAITPTSAPPILT